MKQKKSCSNCIKGSAVLVNNDILCREKGIVSQDYVCRKHRFNPEPKSFKEMNYKCIDCSNFIANNKDNETEPSNGLCQLFSVREFNGREKSACSKFVKKPISIVS
ncbi:MAG TPA: hypothetical protein GXX14_08925 [Clostridiaceae bacterium]|nr:hypothetical protein [Clostridiaceae bacterium]